MPVVSNVQSRVIPAPPDAVRPLLERLAEPGGGIWPEESWPGLRLHAGLEPGSRGGHGPIRYEVIDHVPGQLLRCRFDPRIGADGYHEFTVHPAEGGTEVRHLLLAVTRGQMRWAWPVAVRWLHEALLVDLLDNWERAATGVVRRPARWSPWVRLLRYRLPRATGRLTVSSQSRA